jgi:hypothetical protein
MTDLEAALWKLTEQLDPIAKQRLFLALATKAANERYAAAFGPDAQMQPVELELV